MRRVPLSRLRESEVHEDPSPLAGEEEVRGLHVPVDDPLLVERVEGAAPSPRFPDRDEEPVVAVALGRAQQLALDREDAATLLTGRLGDELLDPGAEARDLLGQDERELVAPGSRRFAQDRTEPGARIVCGWDTGVAGAPHRRCPVEQRVDRYAGERSRNQPEVGERGVSTADLGRALEDTAEAALLGQRGQRRPRIGDRDEVIAGRARAVPLHSLEEVIEMGAGLDRAARLAGGDEEGPAEL